MFVEPLWLKVPYRDGNSKHYCPSFGKPRISIDSGVTAVTNLPPRLFCLKQKASVLKPANPISSNVANVGSMLKGDQNKQVKRAAVKHRIGAPTITGYAIYGSPHPHISLPSG
jgi:hypothetical protein